MSVDQVEGSKKVIEIYDTTLRDGAQSNLVNFSLLDKLNLAEQILKTGIDFVEGGWPSSNPKDMEFFERVQKTEISPRITAFSMTKRKDTGLESDLNLQTSLKSGAELICIFGKSWDLHVTEVLKVSLEENLEIIESTIKYLRSKGKEVIFDAEHFFDGYKQNPEYALKTLLAAEKAGARTLVLCDTNGGCLPDEIYNITEQVAPQLKTPLGIHCHNDSGCAVANTLAAVKAGAVHVQGTINGLGERTGTADLCVVIPNIALKLGYSTNVKLNELTSLSQYVWEVTNLKPNPYQPFVGKYAFSHKAGVHADAVSKIKRSYEQIEPELVGNTTSISISETAGRSNIVHMLKELGLQVEKDDPRVVQLLKKVKELESRGYQLENANGNLYLLVLKVFNKYNKMFEVLDWSCSSGEGKSGMMASALVCLKVNEELFSIPAVGNGPVNALDKALRAAISKHYPKIEKMELINYRVYVVDEGEGTAASVRVHIEFAANGLVWATTGVSTNIMKASKDALVRGYEYYLHYLQQPLKVNGKAIVKSR